jgi:hypothetical protein
MQSTLLVALILPKACILLAENESSSAGRCKHIDSKFRFVAEAISYGLVKIRYIHIQLFRYPHKTFNRSNVSEDDRNLSGIKRYPDR